MEVQWRKWAGTKSEWARYMAWQTVFWTPMSFLVLAAPFSTKQWPKYLLSSYPVNNFIRNTENRCILDEWLTMFCKPKGITMENHFKYVFILGLSVFDHLGMCTTHVLGWGEAVQSLFHWSLSIVPLTWQMHIFLLLNVYPLHVVTKQLLSAATLGFFLPFSWLLLLSKTSLILVH